MKVLPKQRRHTKEQAAVGFHYSVLLLYPCINTFCIPLASTMLKQYTIFLKLVATQ